MQSRQVHSTDDCCLRGFPPRVFSGHMRLREALHPLELYNYYNICVEASTCAYLNTNYTIRCSLQAMSREPIWYARLPQGSPQLHSKQLNINPKIYTYI